MYRTFVKFDNQNALEFRKFDITYFTINTKFCDLPSLRLISENLIKKAKNTLKFRTCKYYRKKIKITFSWLNVLNLARYRQTFEKPSLRQIAKNVTKKTEFENIVKSCLNYLK